MKNPKYIYKSEPKLLKFEFISEGSKGLIKKLVEYTETETENVFNLGFGDFDEKTGDIDDLPVTNNGDSLKVLATVASTVYAFMKDRPKAIIFASESTNVRTRLYRMGISNNLDEINEDFNVYGLNLDENWESFIVGEDYLAFVLSHKQNKLFI